MRYSEITKNQINEGPFGSTHGFPGYGLALFRRAYYQHIAQAIHDIEDSEARKFLANWFSDLFKKDHPSFKPHQFLSAVEKGGYSAHPQYQQRHFYYLAHHVAKIEDGHIRKFLTDWLADVIGSTNEFFQRKRWEKFCTPKEQIEENEMLDEYGRHGFPGYGRKLFSRQHFVFVANNLNMIEDEHAREFLVDWFSDLFSSDHPGFKRDAFKKAVANGIETTSTYPTFQQRHFYYLAQYVSEVQDPHVREFLTNWIADTIGRTNHSFQRGRWDKFCEPKNV